ncbi:FeoB-associated Cys-rich membrane protein [Rubripirellula reticaptiva]|uniref:Virus attachment protein p12 family protein n=1 Tax=Rubripirellula reticaptiva TaxID=2528013 RepID=A0A5C6EIB2_9BACT|nr:FeoB-associated Cys-rich membrane protein [Rubripirellula reticaptiva]TWU48185.1 hypothetical protein Poly59_50310 [Rubripirellula reticaptiva]
MNWQNIIATAIVAVASLWLLRRVYRTISRGLRSGSGNVGGCGTCSKNPNNVDATPLVSLGRKKP